METARVALIAFSIANIFSIGLTYNVVYGQIVGNTGTVSLDQPTYNVGDMAVVTLEDPDLNLDPILPDVYQITPGDDFIDLSSNGGADVLIDGIFWQDSSSAGCSGTPGTPDGLGDSSFDLVETGPSTGIFTGDFIVPDTFCDGASQVLAPGNDLSFHYLDLLDEFGGVTDVFATASILDAADVSNPGDMYGSSGQSGIDPGSIFLVSQVDGSQTFIGDPTSAGGLSGLAFDDQNRLWGSNVFGPGGSNLLEINPSDGSLINDVGPIQLAIGDDVKIQDLGFDPISKQLFGTSENTLYTIDRITGIATPVGLLPSSPGHIGFAPDGTLFMVDRSSSGTLFTLDPTNAGILTSVARSNLVELDALGVSPLGIIFVSPSTFEGVGEFIQTIDTAGIMTVVGSGTRQVADLTFVPDLAIGGTLIPIDTTALLVAGAQIISPWLILGVIAAVGIGLAVFTLKRNR